MIMKKCDVAFITGIIICIIIITCIDKLSFLDHVFVKNSKVVLTGWSISHYVTYFFIGYLCPENFQTYMMIGLMWEIFEKCYGKLTDRELYWTSSGLQGQLFDIIMNILGYISGNYLQSILKK